MAKKFTPVLVIIYNHSFPKNIEKLEYIYKNRFSKCFHLVPNYEPQEHETNVIPVSSHSIYFHGQVAEGLPSYFESDASHYIFCADDLLLNPEINENNFANYFQVNDSKGYIGEFVSITPSIINIPKTQLPIINKPYGIKLESWGNTHYAYRFNPLKYNNKERLPNPSHVFNYFKPYNLYFNYAKRALRLPQFIHTLSLISVINKYISMVSKYFIIYILHLPFLWLIKQFHNFYSFKTRYPLAAGFSDIFIVPQSNIKRFAHYANYFAVAKLFVEIAIPMCFALSNTPVHTPQVYIKKYKKGQYTHGQFNQYKIYEHTDWYGPFPIPKEKCTTINDILENWPKEYLYIHYFKLSNINYK